MEGCVVWHGVCKEVGDKNRTDMIEVKFGICDKVWYFNTASRKVEKAEVKGIQILPTGISKGENGENRLDGYVVLYSTVEGPVLSAEEAYASEAECKEKVREIVEGWE